jgi:hypothetical protein
MKTFPTVEDYLEVIAGKRDIASGYIRPLSMFGSNTPLVSLARYDVGFVSSVTDTTTVGNALTDKQAELSLKLIEKYRRQLNAHGVSVEPIVESPRYRVPLRIIDRSKEVKQVGDKIELRFPYEAKLIEVIRDMSKQSQGKIIFNRERKVWDIALTEFNVNWVMQFAESNQFQIDPQLHSHMQKILECEQTNFDIRLVVTDRGYEITNAEQTLIDYVNERGGFEHDNLLTLVDLSTTLGYSVDEPIQQYIEETYGASNRLLIGNREYEFNDNPDSIERIMSYAQLTNRWPIVVFNPTPIDTFDLWAKHFEDGQVCKLQNKKQEDVTADHRLIYTIKPLRSLSRIPLLVSHVGMVIGQDKTAMVDRSDKIFYTGIKLGTKQ